MFKINDYVVYGTNGVCKIADIESMNLRNQLLEYYVLSPVNDKKMTIKIPVNNNKILIRELMTKTEVMSLIGYISKNETMEIEDYRKKNQEYKSIIRSGNVLEIIKVINSIKSEENEKSSLGKKINKTEEDILVDAKKHLYEEMGMVLGINVDEVEGYIGDNI
ncbi:CarD family transcriptional regulator [Clostridium sp. AL.422]|uniref:CarD family transcriptional regulator n=1 Tax=Clostridium TaxID=1485 RepID=UPI00293DD941|nr:MULTISPECIES: CarD family transcriptional regulator [unclassified Clostridium]MDV4152618.1 CarD family transcriptional regulator [Clostridium sp. AL.422]